MVNSIGYFYSNDIGNYMTKILGIIGGGQLGMMIAEAKKMPENVSKIIVLDPTENCPAAQVGSRANCCRF